MMELGEIAALISILFYVFCIALVIIPYWLLWKRTGHSGAWSLFLILPVTNVLVPYILAFKRWPRFDKSEAADDVFE